MYPDRRKRLENVYFVLILWISLYASGCMAWLSDSSSFPSKARWIVSTSKQHQPYRSSVLFSTPQWDDDSPNAWQSGTGNGFSSNQEEDWQEVLKRKQNGTYWSQMAASTDPTTSKSATSKQQPIDDDTEAEAWLDTLASLASEEIEFNIREAERANTARQMEEWGFDKEIIKNALGIEVDTKLEVKDEVAGMQTYREKAYLDDIDLSTVESHTTVETDPETQEPVRTQMVFVDEHTCIGCTNCANVAQSTFYMNPEHGRARVFQQWGDTDETIQIAIETCPVDCIHYVHYDELVALEKSRRNQNINFKARLVSQAEFGNVPSHLSGGVNRFTAPPKISGNMKTRCNNCPTRGCRDCPMYGVGKNPEFERKEQERKARLAKRQVQELREREEKRAEL